MTNPIYGPRDHEECQCGATLIDTPACPRCNPEWAEEFAALDSNEESPEEYDAAWESERYLRYAEGWG